MELIVRRRQQPSINIVPLVDVLTVLLFFFLVTMQFKQLTALNILAPEIETAGENKTDLHLVIAVDPEGQFFLDAARIEPDALKAALKLASEATPDVPILLLSDESTPLKYVTQIMDLCRSNQLNTIRLQSR